MDLSESTRFPELSLPRLDAYARERAGEIGLNIAQGYVPAVLENLIALQTHAAILAAGLEAAEPQSLQTSAS